MYRYNTIQTVFKCTIHFKSTCIARRALSECPGMLGIKKATYKLTEKNWRKFPK